MLAVTDQVAVVERWANLLSKDWRLTNAGRVTLTEQQLALVEDLIQKQPVTSQIGGRSAFDLWVIPERWIGLPQKMQLLGPDGRIEPFRLLAQLPAIEAAGGAGRPAQPYCLYDVRWRILELAAGEPLGRAVRQLKDELLQLAAQPLVANELADMLLFGPSRLGSRLLSIAGYWNAPLPQLAVLPGGPVLSWAAPSGAAESWLVPYARYVV